MIRQSLSQKLTQKMSPRQIQLMKLLQIPTFELEQRIKEEIESNPALEEGNNDTYEESGYSDDDMHPGDDIRMDMDDYFPDYSEDGSDYTSPADGYDPDNKQERQIASHESNLQDYLLGQLELVDFEDETDKIIGQQIIGSIDEDGYLRREPIAITDDLLFSSNMSISEEQVVKVLTVIQGFDPKGVGARTLQEALLIQIRSKLNNTSELDEYKLKDLQAAEIILRDYFNEFSKKHFSKLAQNLEIDEDDLKAAYEEILKLNPKPGSGFSMGGTTSIQYIEPDFIIVNRDGTLELSLNSRNSPDLKVSNGYKSMIRELQRKKKMGKLSKEDRNTALFVKQKIEAAQTFIESIQRRQSTLYNTMHAIMMYQYDYFLTGDTQYLKPLILKDIAEEIGMDISTVSRVANSKYVQTEFGTKLLKEFFSEKVQNNDGEDVTTREVKQILSSIIEKEDKSNPLSDEALMELLDKTGISLSRRTISKYREKMNIPVARLRKEL
ncbi:MAG TPA: RNA polymerase factor sigma-54 [Saprospiraceae bacterium]|nr:MAG: RNA polymerase sigma 54 subunit RpoN [Candidatus Parvibacillus calidus]MCC7149489.1 RNA polymerase factor sigma-54 [Saprospiraceae bacterium]WKZ64271.1 MAG: RNA polymerase factor sigma-54 [Saprospiraceae bacterium]HRN33391.1 RNA polymerase factor sigma-54 [Saprospiraceae bacterium]